MTVGEYFKTTDLPAEMCTRDQAERYIEGTYIPPRGSNVSTTMNAVLYLIGEFDHELMCNSRTCRICPYYAGEMGVAGCRKNRLQHIKELYNRRRRGDIEIML